MYSLSLNLVKTHRVYAVGPLGPTNSDLCSEIVVKVSHVSAEVVRSNVGVKLIPLHHVESLRYMAHKLQQAHQRRRAVLGIALAKFLRLKIADR